MTLVSAAGAQADSGLIGFGKEDAEYLEGESVVIRLDSTIVNQGEKVEVECRDCPAATFFHEFTQHEADQVGGTVEFVFPDDFQTEAEGEPNPEFQGQPRWADTWEVHVTGVAPSQDSDTFQVHLIAWHEIPTVDFRPGQVARIQAGGYPDPNTRTPVSVKIYHHPEGGEREIIRNYTVHTGRNDPKATTAFGPQGVSAESPPWPRIPPEVARHLDCEGFSESECSRFEVEVDAEAGDKGSESQFFRVSPATIDVDTDNSTVPNVVNRTEEAFSITRLWYQGSEDQDGDLNPGHLYLSRFPSQGGVKSITMRLQRLTDGCTDTTEPETVATVEAPATTFAFDRYRPEHLIPRDFPIHTGATNDSFRWVVLEQEDAYGNEIERHAMDCFWIEEYELKPVPVEVPELMERWEPETFVFNFTFADGTPLTPDILRDDHALEGTLKMTDDDGCPPPTIGAHPEAVNFTADHVRGGLWEWSYEFPKDYQNLGEWRFCFSGNDGPSNTAEDDAGNLIVANDTSPFTVDVAEPRVELTTAANGEVRNRTRGFDRGDTVSLRVVTTYPNGKPLNASDLNATEGPGDELPVDVVRRDESGQVTNVTELYLDQVQPFLGSWRGSFEIPNDAVESLGPLGTWNIDVSVRDDVDPANVNRTTFERKVHPDTLHVSTADPPARTVLAGREVQWAFRVRDSHGDLVTDERTGDAESGTITVDVREWDNGKPGPIVREGLIPKFDPGFGEGAWVIEWTPPRGIEPGDYVLAPNGTDIHGNPLADQARSRPIDVEIERVPRDTVISPPLSVTRGEDVVVVFDGRPGDTGRNGSGNPSIVLERRASQDRWVVEEEDVYRANESSGEDHLGVFNTTTTTPDDEYRFRIEGRAPDQSFINGTSDAFQVRPKNVTREVLRPIVPFAKKGSTVSAVVNHRPFGDDLSASDIRIEGPGNITDAPGRRSVDDRPGNWSVSWTIPLTVPEGEYVLHLNGEDRHGNNITALLGPVRVGPVNLSVEPLSPPRPKVERVSQVEFSFRVTYPDGSLMKDAHGTPSVVVTRDGAAHDEVNATFDGVNWHARWTPPAAAELGTYGFRVSGFDKADNPIRSLDSRTFRLEPGTVVRDVREGPDGEASRLSEVTIQVEAAPDDRFVEFELRHFGGRNPDNAPGDPDPQFTGTLTHEWRPSLGVYEVRWTPPKDQDLGFYRVVVEGEDPHGNAIHADTGAFQVTPAFLETRWRDGIDSIPLSEARDYRVRITYPGGSFLTPQDGTPDFFLRLNGQPVEQQPEAVWDGTENLWKARWEWPDELPHGTYAFVVRGTDAHGNDIGLSVSDGTTYEPGTLDQLTGATVPGPSPALAAAAGLLAAVAAAAGRPLSRR